MKRTIFTIGYEGSQLSEFLDTLASAGVQQVLDIRDIPVSRKPGFSKSSLMAALRSRGMSYLHLKALGDPKPGREAMRRGDHGAFRKIYANHLETPAAQVALRDAVEHASAKVSVLLCFERNPKDCHRTIVAMEMEAAAGFDVQAIGVRLRAVSQTASRISSTVDILITQ